MVDKENNPNSPTHYDEYAFQAGKEIVVENNTTVVIGLESNKNLPKNPHVALSQVDAVSFDKSKEINIKVSDDKVVYGEIKISDIRELNIPLSSKEVILAKYGEIKIKELDANYTGERIKTLINLAIFETQFKTENISQLILMVVKDIFSDFGDNTLSEVEQAYRRGVRGEYGQIMGMSVRTFYGWMKYYNEITRYDAMRYLMNAKPKEHKALKLIADSEKEKASHIEWLHLHIDNFNKYKKLKVVKIHDFGNLLYDYLDKNKIGSLNKDEKTELYQIATDIIKKRYAREKAKTPYQADDFKLVVKSIMESKVSKTTDDEIKSEAKRLAIFRIFDKLIEQEKELSDIFSAIENIDLNKKS